MVNWSRTRWQTSSDQRLNVSMSLAAHTPNDDTSALEQYQPAWEMLVFHERTCSIASSSSFSVASEMARRPSDEPERTRGDDTVGWNDNVVMSSEWVEACSYRGALGWRGSLRDFQEYCTIESQSRRYQYRMNASSSASSVPAATIFPSEEASQQRTALKMSSGFFTITSLITQAKSLELSYTYIWPLENQTYRPKPWLIHLSQTIKVRHWGNQPGSQLHEWTSLPNHVREESVFGEEIPYLVSRFCGMEKRPVQHRQSAGLQETTHKRLHGLRKRTHGDRVPHTEMTIPALRFSRFFTVSIEIYISRVARV